jgi:hypothetical protein
MAITATINGTSVSIKTGWVLRDHYNETLDGGTIMVPQTNRLTIRPYDEVVLSGSPLSAEKRFLVAHYSERQIAFTPTAKYEYSISLVSKTIKLQRTFLPNISITQPVTGPGITIAQAITRYNAIYGEKKLVSGNQANAWTLSGQLAAMTALVPEFTLSKPNLFELFNTILARENKIIILRGDNVLDYFDLTKKYDPIDTTKLTYTEQTENGAEYLSETEIEFFNVLTDSKDSDAGLDVPIETTIRADASVLTTENATLILEKPIYKIISIKYIHATNEDMAAGDIAYKEYDITNYIVERTEYELLTTNPLGSGTKRYQRLYYTQGGNQIGGLMYRPFTLLPEAIYQIASLATGGDGLTGGLSLHPDYGIGRWLFRIKYIPQNDAKMRTSKYKAEPYAAITIDGQKANYGNLDLIADEQFKNAQRIGQPERTITASRYTTESQVPKLGDYLNEYIVVSREISYNDGFIVFKGTMAKDYVNKTMFTGVTSKRRLYEIASGAESVARHDLIKLYYQFSRTNPTNNTQGFTLSSEFTRRVLDGTTNLKPVAVIVRTYNTDPTLGEIQNQNYAILKETIEQAAGNSILWSFEMQDNYSAGLKQDGAVTGGTALRYVSYVDTLGRFESIKMTFINSTQAQTKYIFPASMNQILVEWANGQEFMDYTTTTNLTNYIGKFQELPEIPLTDIPATNILEVQKTLWKDNREITKITLQHEFVADDLDIVVGFQIAKTSRLFKNTSITRYFLYSTGTHRYNIYENKTAVGTSINLGTNPTLVTYPFNANSTTEATIVVDTAGFTTLTGVAWANVTSWAIATSTGELILGVNKKTTDTTIPATLWLNLFVNRHL